MLDKRRNITNYENNCTMQREILNEGNIIDRNAENFKRIREEEPQHPAKKRCTSYDQNSKECKNNFGGGVRVKNSGGVVKTVSYSFNNSKLYDIIINVSDRKFFLYRFLLMQSDVFRVMLTSDAWSDPEMREISLTEENICLPYMEHFLKYFYTGEAYLDKDSIGPIAILANKYGVKELELACEKHACTLTFAGTDIAKILEWWELSEKLGYNTLQGTTFEYIVMNMDLLLNYSECYMSLNIEQWCSLLTQTNMIVSSEESLYKCVMKWAEQFTDIKLKKIYLEKIAPLIHFYQIVPEELMIIENTLKNDDLMYSIFENFVTSSFKYHSIPFCQRSLNELSKYDNSRIYIGTKDAKSPITNTMRLSPSQKALLKDGIYRVVHVPISLSSADKFSKKNWNCVVKETSGCIKFQASTLIDKMDDFGMVEASFLIYRQINDITFVKEVMQLRDIGQVRSPCDKGNKIGHAFSITLPEGSLDINSFYQLHDKDSSYFKFQLAIRYYHNCESDIGTLNLLPSQKLDVISSEIISKKKYLSLVDFTNIFQSAS